MRQPKYLTHPLCMLFGARRMPYKAAMNWLQERGHISDCCVDVEDVAPVDVEAVLRKAGMECFLPAVERLKRGEIETFPGAWWKRI